MKIFKSIILAAAVFLSFLSCQKELRFDNGGVSAGVFKKDVSGDCLPITVNGIFKKDSVLTNANFVDVQVNVSTPGTFDIKSDSANGYTFRKAGSVVFGTNTIRLYAIGKPIAAGSNTFTVKYGASTCKFSITVAGPGILPAVYTLGGSPAGCTLATAGGTYIENTPLTPANTLTIQVDVTTPGSYVLSATTANGFLFTGSGLFTSPGLQNVTLTGKGTPVAAGVSAVTVTNIASSCNFSVIVQPALPPAVFTLDGTPNSCTSFIVNGTYTVGIATSAGNTVKLNVNVVTAGTYSINTNTANGISFRGTGILATGPQQITLTATGIPTSSGSFNFTPGVGAGTCTFSVTVPPPPPPAVFTLSGAPNACAPATVNGTYAISTALGASHTVVVQVNVTVTGIYTLSTNTVNGMIFSKSGVFTSTGLQNVTLQGSGSPIVAGTSTLVPQIGTSSCTFDVIVAAPPAGIYTCKIDGVFTSFNDRAKAEVLTFGIPNLFLDGYTGAPNGGFVPEFQIFIDKNDGSPITQGTYNEKSYLLPNGHHIEIDYKAENPDLTVTIWNTSSNIFPPPHPAFTIIVTSINSTRVKGTFSGTLTNTLQGSNLFKTITEGVFDLPIQ